MLVKNNGTAKDVGAQLGSTDLTGGNVLKGGPIFGFDEDLLTQPLGDGLLSQGWAAKEVGQAFRKGSLASRDLDRPLQGGNVRFIHEHARYTTRVVQVNNQGRMTHYNGGCTVLPMVSKRSNAVVAPKAEHGKPRVRLADVGPDGKTLGDRVRIGMEARARQLGLRPEDYGQKELLAEANRAVGRNVEAGDRPVLTQQALSLILNNKVSESHASIALALVFAAEPAWLQYGIGDPSYLHRGLKKK